MLSLLLALSLSLQAASRVGDKPVAPSGLATPVQSALPASTEAAAQAANGEASASQATPQLDALGEKLRSEQPQEGSGGQSEAPSLATAFDGTRKMQGCAHCDHIDDDAAAASLPTDTAGNFYVVPSNLKPLLPSSRANNPKDWTGRMTFHLHSVFSDGTLSPEEVVELAYSQGVREMALSDHDTAAGIMRAWRKAKALGMTFHPAIELSARGGVHIGAVDVDITNAKLVALMERVRAKRLAFAQSIVDHLNKHPDVIAKGVTITLDEVRAKSKHDEGGTIELPHVARVLVDKGLIEHVDDAFDTFLKGDVLDNSHGTPDPTADEVLEAVRAAGGKAFLNHPYTVRGVDDDAKDAAVEALLEKGFDGIEVYRPIHARSKEGWRRADERAAKYLSWIDERNLMAGNGADFHGTDTHLADVVVWMPKTLAQQLADGLKDVNARALAVLERLDAAPTSKAKVMGAALAPLALSSAGATSHESLWGLLLAGLVAALIGGVISVLIAPPDR